MKGLLLLFAIAVLFGVAACGVTVPAATPTPAVISLPASNSGSGTAPVGARGAGGTALQPPATNVQAAAAPTQASSPTPTRVLNAPLSAVLPQPSATITPAAVAAQPSTPATTATALQPPATNPQAAPAQAPSPAPSGRFVIQLASGGDIITINSDGTGQKRLAAGLDPSWSPDGKQIAFASWNEPQGIYVMNADGSDLHPVYHINGAKNPVWSPDGSAIAFTWKYKSTQRTDRQGLAVGLAQDYWRISMVNLATGNKTDMPMDPDLHAFAADWGPNGQMAYKGMRGLFISDMIKTPLQITQYPRDDTPVWSPDGTHIALATYRQDHWDIAVANADGSGYTEITSSPSTFGVKPVNNVAPRWSPDGKSIAFVSDRDGAWYIYVMNPDGSNQRKLLDIPIKYDFASERVFSWTK